MAPGGRKERSVTRAWRRKVKKEEWELAALGERTLRTVEQSEATLELLKAKAEAFNRQLGLR